MPAVAIKNEYETINEKMGETLSLPAEKLQASEYNTRCTCIDQSHVNRLAKKIKERGFHPKRAISVNVIRGANGSEVNYRVAAGVHRLAAAKTAELAEIPCLLYYDLSDEEECLLDRWDNEMDEAHKKIHFLEEAEHCKYLYEVKGWSYREIGKAKGIAHTEVIRKIKIASMPEEAKKIVNTGGGGNTVTTFSEGHFRDICKLSEPHIITICKEIVAKAEQAEKGEKDRMGIPIRPMKQADIKKKVYELLRLEEKGKREIVIQELAPIQLTLFPEEVKEQSLIEKKVIVDVGDIIAEVRKKEPLCEVHEFIAEIVSDTLQRTEEKNGRGIHMDRCIRWLDETGLVTELGLTNFFVLQKLIRADLWYRPNEDKPFFFGEEAAGDPFAYIARGAGVGREHIQKRGLPLLKKEGFINYWEEKGTYWFKLNWDRLAEVYCKTAYGIHYKDEGLKNIPEDFSGVIRPTPFHYIRVEKGKVVTWNGTTLETLQQKTTAQAKQQPVPSQELDEKDALVSALRSLKPPMNDEQIGALCREKREVTATVLKLLNEKTDEQRKAIKNEAAYVLDLVKREEKLQLPKGFVTPEEAKSREERKKALSAFIAILKEKKYKKFCPNDKSCYTIIDIDDCGFSYEKEEGDYPYAYFEKWMDEKFFR
jgi:ParB-like chromosome segregation protein Spo0J